MDYSQPELDSLQSPKDQVQLIFNMVKDTHDIKIAGEEKVAGRDTYKIVAKRRIRNRYSAILKLGLIKDLADIKMKTDSAGTHMLTEYSKINFGEK